MKRVYPSHPDRAAREVEEFVRQYADWVRSIPIKSWQSLRRLAPNAEGYWELSGAFDQYLEGSAARDKTGSGWGRQDARERLRKAFQDSKEADGSAGGERFAAWLAPPEKKLRALARQINDPVREFVQLRMARHFIDVLVTVACRVIDRREQYLVQAENWVLEHADTVAAMRNAGWDQLTRAGRTARNPEEFIAALVGGLEEIARPYPVNARDMTRDFAIAAERAAESSNHEDRMTGIAKFAEQASCIGRCLAGAGEENA